MAERMLDRDQGLGSMSPTSAEGRELIKARLRAERDAPREADTRAVEAAAELEAMEAEDARAAEARAALLAKVPDALVTFRAREERLRELERLAEEQLKPMLEEYRSALGELRETRLELLELVRLGVPGSASLRGSRATRETEEAWDTLVAGLEREQADLLTFIFDHPNGAATVRGLLDAVLLRQVPGLEWSQVESIVRDTKVELPAGPASAESMASVRGAILGRS